MKFGRRSVGEDQPIYLIAEMACAHDGSVAKAMQLVDAAVDANADAIQMQLFSAGDLMVPEHEVYKLLVDIQFDAGEWRQIWSHARARGIDVLACTYDLPSVDLALELGVDGIKINSSDLSHEEMLRAVCRSGVPFTVGTGASTLQEIGDAVSFCQGLQNAGFILMHGVQNFPTPVGAASIQRIRELAERFHLPVGYQDHTDAEDPFCHVVDLLAVGLGVQVLEKHITLSRREKGTDYQAALEPDELARWVERIRQAEQAMGSQKFDALTEGDMRYRQFQKKNIVAACEIPAGAVITIDKVRFMRAGRGLAPSERTVVIGRRAARSLAPYQPIVPEDLQV